MRNLSASLDAVLRLKSLQAMTVQRYDMRLCDGISETRFWKPVNVPILDAHGEVDFIRH